MNKKLLKALLAYIDAKIEYEFARREVGADGEGVTPLTERKALEAGS